MKWREHSPITNMAHFTDLGLDVMVLQLSLVIGWRLVGFLVKNTQIFPDRVCLSQHPDK